MSFLVVLITTAAVVAVAHRCIHRMPWLWYGLAVALDLLDVAGV